MERRRNKALIVLGCVIARKQIARLDELAAREQRSRSFLIRAAIEQYLAAQQQRAEAAR